MTRERTLYLFDTLPEIARDRAPTFTFAHILAPHPPFVFGANGEDVSPRETRYLLSDGTCSGSYYAGVELHPRLPRAGGLPRSSGSSRRSTRSSPNSPEPPIIIIQSDHGSGSKLDIESLEKTDVHERMSILNAYYFPDRKARTRAFTTRSRRSTRSASSSTPTSAPASPPPRPELLLDLGQPVRVHRRHRQVQASQDAKHERTKRTPSIPSRRP